MREFINIIKEAQAEWRNWDDNAKHQELCIGGNIIQVNYEKKKSEMDGGPFFSGFDLTGNTDEELRADAIRQAYKRLKEQLLEFEATAKELGIKLL